MNRQDFESWMKQKIEQQDYTPSPAMWDKLQSDLSAGKKSKRTILLLPVSKIAASVALLLTAGYFMLSQKDNESQAITAIKISQLKTDRQPQSVAATAFAVKQRSEEVKTISQKNRLETQHKIAARSQERVENTGLRFDNQPNVATIKEQQNVTSTNSNIEKPISYPFDAPTFITAQNEPAKKSAVGVAAHIGSPGLGTVGYQIGLMGRHNISDRIFVEGTIAVASTTINLERSYSFTSVNMGADGLTNSFAKETTDVQAKYARNVVAVGANPSLGLKLTRKFSVSGGVGVYRNITPSLVLTNGDDFGSDAQNEAVISNKHGISTWDLGLTGNADYKVNTKLSLNVNYRRGLTDYYQYNNKGYKNSMVNIGIKYMFSE